MPEDLLPQDQDPAAQADESPKDTPNQPDYKGFFDKQIENRTNEKASLEQRLSEKLTDVQRLQIEKQIFAIEKEFHELGITNASVKDTVVEQIVGAGIQPGTPAYNFLKESTKNLDVGEASAFIEVMSEFAKLLGTTGSKPVDLNNRPRGDAPAKGDTVGFQAKDILGDNGSVAKSNLKELMGAIVARGGL